jgi:membrane protease YdiL (CAAX protease family)/TM2 domain-containing membrane protein YozV
MRICLLFFLGGLTAVASAQEMSSSLPSSQPATPAATPLDEAAKALDPSSEPTLLSVPGLSLVGPDSFTPPPPIPARSSPATAGLLAIIPGAGHFYLGKPVVGSAYLGTTLSFGVLTAGVQDAGFPGLLIGSLTQNLWFYNIFDAYRDARIKRADVGYQYPITREPLAKLVSAPFRPSVLKNPLVWAGVPAALIGGLGISLLAEEVFSGAKVTPMSLRSMPLLRSRLTAKLSGEDAATIAVGSTIFAATFLSVGVGEEALFRGCFQSGLTQKLGSTAGWLTASLLFGAVHISNFVERDPITLERTGFNEAGYLAVPYITLVGAGLGYMYKKDNYKLETGIAAHFWYDFLLSVSSLFSLANNGAASLQFSFQL